MKTLFRNFKLILITFAIVSITSCSKDDDNSPPSTAELLAHKWYFVQQEDLTTMPTTVSIFDSCQQNNYVSFASNGNTIYESFNFNMNNCVSEGLQAYIYDLNASGTVIYITDGDITGDWIIDSISKTQLVVIIGNGTVKLTLDR